MEGCVMSDSKVVGFSVRRGAGTVCIHTGGDGICGLCDAPDGVPVDDYKPSLGAMEAAATLRSLPWSEDRPERCNELMRSIDAHRLKG